MRTQLSFSKTVCNVTKSGCEKDSVLSSAYLKSFPFSIK